MTVPSQVGYQHYCCEVVVRHESGLHARPAMQVVEAANRFDCSTKILHGNGHADCKSILQVLSLAAEAGTRVMVETCGEGALDAVRIVAELIAGQEVSCEECDNATGIPKRLV